MNAGQLEFSFLVPLSSYNTFHPGNELANATETVRRLPGIPQHIINNQALISEYAHWLQKEFSCRKGNPDVLYYAITPLTDKLNQSNLYTHSQEENAHFFYDNEAKNICYAHTIYYTCFKEEKNVPSDMIQNIKINPFFNSQDKLVATQISYTVRLTEKGLKKGLNLNEISKKFEYRSAPIRFVTRSSINKINIELKLLLNLFQFDTPEANLDLIEQNLLALDLTRLKDSLALKLAVAYCENCIDSSNMRLTDDCHNQTINIAKKLNELKNIPNIKNNDQLKHSIKDITDEFSTLVEHLSALDDTKNLQILDNNLKENSPESARFNSLVDFYKHAYHKLYIKQKKRVNIYINSLLPEQQKENLFNIASKHKNNSMSLLERLEYKLQNFSLVIKFAVVLSGILTFGILPWLIDKFTAINFFKNKNLDDLLYQTETEKNQEINSDKLIEKYGQYLNKCKQKISSDSHGKMAERLPAVHLPPESENEQKSAILDGSSSGPATVISTTSENSLDDGRCYEEDSQNLYSRSQSPEPPSPSLKQ